MRQKFQTSLSLLVLGVFDDAGFNDFV